MDNTTARNVSLWSWVVNSQVFIVSPFCPKRNSRTPTTITTIRIITIQHLTIGASPHNRMLYPWLKTVKAKRNRPSLNQSRVAQLAACIGQQMLSTFCPHSAYVEIFTFAIKCRKSIFLGSKTTVFSIPATEMQCFLIFWFPHLHNLLQPASRKQCTYK